MYFPSRRCWLVLSVLAVTAFASSGDRAKEFQDCTASCQTDTCQNSDGGQLPLFLRLTLWTCLDDCKYTCMHTLTNNAVQNGGYIQQYYGKWPFWRLFGMQEPASVLFSLLNLWAHVRGGKFIRRKIPEGHPMRRYYLWWSALSMNAWVWSAVFHTRDKPFTEKMDYFSAAAAILFGLYLTVVRLFHLFPIADRTRLTSFPHVASQNKDHTLLHRVWSALCTLMYLAHISYLTLLPRFDYTYNMTFNLTIGLTHNALWLLYALPSSLTLFRRFPSSMLAKTYRPKYANKAALFVLLTTAATALELFDFPPWWRTVDAHALWHLSTVPIIPFWYAFLVEDALDEGWRSGKT